MDKRSYPPVSATNLPIRARLVFRQLVLVGAASMTWACIGLTPQEKEQAKILEEGAKNKDAAAAAPNDGKCEALEGILVHDFNDVYAGRFGVFNPANEAKVAGWVNYGYGDGKVLLGNVAPEGLIKQEEAGCDMSGAAGISGRGSSWAEFQLYEGGCIDTTKYTGLRFNLRAKKGGVWVTSNKGPGKTFGAAPGWQTAEVKFKEDLNLEGDCWGESLKLKTTDPSNYEFYIDNLTVF